jgi:hypothetical protein
MPGAMRRVLRPNCPLLTDQPTTLPSRIKLAKM